MKYTILLLFSFLSSLLIAQAPPQGINYQAVAYDLTSIATPGIDYGLLPAAERDIRVRFTINADNIGGNRVYREYHTTQTDINGLFNLIIGQGILDNAPNAFEDIDWGTGDHFLIVEIDINGGEDYMEISAQQLWSVPYALYAESAGSDIAYIIDNGDGTISITFADSSIYTSPTLSGLTGPQGPQGVQGPQGPAGPIGIGITNVQLNGDSLTITLSSGTDITLTNIFNYDNDRDSTNELQSLSFTGDSITLSNGGGINFNTVINQYIDTIQNNLNTNNGFEYYNAAGSYPLNLTPNITSFFIDIWGAAGSGAVSTSSTSSGGGGGGAGFFHGLLNINPGDQVVVNLGTGGAGVSGTGTGNDGTISNITVNGQTVLTINAGTGGDYDGSGNPLPGNGGTVIVNNTSICKGVSINGSDGLLQEPGGASGPGFQSFNVSRTPTIYGNGSAGRTNGNSTGSGQSGVVLIKW